MPEPHHAPAQRSDDELMYSPPPLQGVSLWMNRSRSFLQSLLAITLIIALALVAFFLCYVFVLYRAAWGK